MANWLNLTTPLGLAIAAAGQARVRPGPHGLLLAEGYRFRFPVAGAFTVGDVVLTASTFASLERSLPGLLGHEERHARQYAAAGVWFWPAYAVATAYSVLTTGDPALRNPLERQAGLLDGGYLDAAGAPTSPVVYTWRGVRPRRGTLRTDAAPNAAPAGDRAAGAGA